MNILYISLNTHTNSIQKKLESFGNVYIIQKNTQFFFQDKLGSIEVLILEYGTRDILSGKFLERCKKLKLLILASTGYEDVDLEEIKKYGIKISYCPGCSAQSVAEYTFFLLLSLVKKRTKKNESYELKGKTLGIIGTGNIGKKVRSIGLSFGMNILGANSSGKKTTDFPEIVDIKKLLAFSDIITLHIPLKDNTKKFLARKCFDLMKQGVFLINTSRYQLVDYEVLLKELNREKILGYAVDSILDFSTKNILKKKRNIIITPHIAYNTKETKQRMEEMIINIVNEYKKERYINTL